MPPALGLWNFLIKLTSFRASRVAQVAERLPSKCEALSSNPNATKKQQKKVTSFIWHCFSTFSTCIFYIFVNVVYMQFCILF
jgi:hypothetical protein